MSQQPYAITDEQVCRAVDHYWCGRRRWGKASNPLYILMTMTQRGRDECLAAMRLAFNKQLIQHNVYIELSWLTKAGYDLLDRDIPLDTPVFNESDSTDHCTQMKGT